MQPTLSVGKLAKTYATGFQALKRIDLDIREGEIFALLGPKGVVIPAGLQPACT